MTMVVIGPSPIERACMVAGLSGLPRMRTTALEDPAEHHGPPPHLVLLQDQPGLRSTWLSDQIGAAKCSWPHAMVLVVGSDDVGRADLCMQSGVRAYLPPQVRSDQIAAVIDLLTDDLVVYPAIALANIAIRDDATNARRRSVTGLQV